MKIPAGNFFLANLPAIFHKHLHQLNYLIFLHWKVTINRGHEVKSSEWRCFIEGSIKDFIHIFYIKCYNRSFLTSTIKLLHFTLFYFFPLLFFNDTFKIKIIFLKCTSISITCIESPRFSFYNHFTYFIP